jgi:hypothetical protein
MVAVEPEAMLLDWMQSSTDLLANGEFGPWPVLVDDPVTGFLQLRR